MAMNLLRGMRPATLSPSRPRLSNRRIHWLASALKPVWSPTAPVGFHRQGDRLLAFGRLAAFSGGATDLRVLVLGLRGARDLGAGGGLLLGRHSRLGAGCDRR